MMQPQILRVDDIEDAIQENGLEYYIDRLLQDWFGDYYYVEPEPFETHVLMDCKIAKIETNEDGSQATTYYKLYRVPKELAWFCIDAIKLKTQVINIGNGVYGNGPHGGDIQYFIKDGDQFKEIPVRAVRVETL